MICLAALLAVVLTEGRPVDGYPRDVPSVCRGTADFLSVPDPLRTCDDATLQIGFRPTCRDQRVHLVYILNVTSDLTDTQLYFMGWGFHKSIHLLNLRSNPNIRVAAVQVRENDAVVTTDGFTNDISEAFQGLRPHSALYGCRRCGLVKALELLRGARDEVAPDEPAEFIAFFSFLGHEEEERELADLARQFIFQFPVGVGQRFVAGGR